MLKPEYNNLKITNSRLGGKLSEATTKLKMFMITDSLKVKKFYKENNLVKEFSNITNVALHLNISNITVTKYLNKYKI